MRIALNLKAISYEQVTYDLRAGAQRGPAYRALHPQGLVPALEVDGTVLAQSPALLEWLEERHPEPRLLPPDATGRAIVRGMAAAIACDIHPLNNLRVLDALRREFGASEATIARWTANWIGDGFAALEILVQRHGGRYAFGDTPTFADCYLVPQIYSAERFAIDLAPYPRLVAAATAARALPAFVAAAPERQPDADQ